MTIVSIIFWLSLAAWFLGFTIQYQEIVIGLCAGIIGVVELLAVLRK